MLHSTFLIPVVVTIVWLQAKVDDEVKWWRVPFTWQETDHASIWTRCSNPPQVAIKQSTYVMLEGVITSLYMLCSSVVLYINNRMRLATPVDITWCRWVLHIPLHVSINLSWRCGIKLMSVIVWSWKSCSLYYSLIPNCITTAETAPQKWARVETTYCWITEQLTSKSLKILHVFW